MTKQSATTKKPAKPTKPAPACAPGMKIAVQNFGPIAKGKIDVRPLTVFAGPSNTGKSWMATLIYIVEQLSLSESFSRRGYLTRREETSLGKISDHKVPEDLKDWIDAIKSGHGIDLKEREIEAVRDIARARASNIIHGLKRCYGVSKIDQLISKNHGRGNLSVAFDIGDITYSLDGPSTPERGSSIKTEEDLLQVSLPKKIKIDESINYERLAYLLDGYSEDVKLYDDAGFKKRARTKLRDHVCEMIINKLAPAGLSTRPSRVYYLPADRGGIMHSHSVVVSALIGRASQAGLRREPRIPLLSGVLGDFLDALLMTANSPRNREMVNKEQLSVSLEERILRGKVKLRISESGYPNFEYQPKGWEDQLPLMTASSMVSELSPVVLFLRYLVLPGDTLILEEPEAHLHPAIQRKLTEEIARWVNKGIKVVLTTHSEWILEGLSNIVARGEAKEKSRRVSLNKEDVGVWIFNQSNSKGPSRGSSIKEVAWDLDDGGYETDFYGVAVEMQNDWANTIEGS